MTIPNIFVGQTLAEAAKVNANFDYLDKRKIEPAVAENTSSRQTASTSFVDLTGASITVQASDDVDVLILVMLHLSLVGLTDVRGMEFQILRGTTVIHGPRNVAEAPSAYKPYMAVVVDSPPGAGTYTYKVQWRAKDASYAVNCNYSSVVRLF